MKNTIFGIFFILFSMSSVAETEPEIDQSVIEFSNTMGINGLINTTLQQTRESLKSSMVDLSSKLRAQYPKLSDEQNKVFVEIFNTYVDSIINSINPDEASYIYTRAIAKGMSKKEVEVASDYYATPEGQNLLKVIGIASTELNQYVLGKITTSAKVAQNQLGKDLANFKNNLTEISSK